MKLHCSNVFFVPLAVVLSSFILASCSALAKTDKNAYSINYTIGFEPKKNIARVEIKIDQQAHLSRINFNLKNSQCSDFSSPDKLERGRDRLLWYPDKTSAKIVYVCKINHRRRGKPDSAYDALMTADWAVFRGDDLVPPARVSGKPSAYSVAKLIFDLPKSWPSVNTGWEPIFDKNEHASSFKVDNPQRRFDRPTGWMIAGNLGTRRSILGEGKKKTRVSVSAPQGSSLRRMDTLAFITVLWPEIEKAFEIQEEHILITGVDDPMWRGGLSAGNSFYVHSDRPIISENGTSTLTHELFHMITGIRGTKNNDWIAEGLAEYYSVEFLYRAGATTKERRQITMEKLRDWSKDVRSVFTSNSKGATTAKAVIIFDNLDLELRQLSDNQNNLDDVTRYLAERANNSKKISFKDLQDAFKKLTGVDSRILSEIQ